MKNFVIEVPVVTPGKAEQTATLTAYIPEATGVTFGSTQNRPAVIIFPGGGYGHLAPREAEPIALNFLCQGVCAFVLRYSIAPARFPQALCEALWSVRYVRQHAEEFCIDPTNIATLGFSAGGHLCGSTGTLWNLPLLREYLPEAAEEYRPDKTILCYPVILSHGSDAHNGSFRSLLGDNYGKEEYMEMNCLDKQVGPHNPPAFIWHTSEDTCVHVENSLFFAMALRKYGIPIEMHIYPHGKHGLALCEHTSLDCAYGVPRNPGVERWITEAQRFLFDTTLCSK